MKGKISQWNDEKGFGFIVSDDEVEKVFFHISSVKTSTRRPQVGDTVIYESSRDAKNRLQARAVAIEGAVVQSGTQPRSQFIQITPPCKNAFDYLLIVILLGCLVGAGWVFYQTRMINESISAYAVAGIMALLVLNRQKKPKEKQFSCARCRAVANFDSRPIQAWNNGFLKLYCNTCHQRWLRENPASARSYSVGRGSGCLGTLCLLFIVPVAAGMVVFHWMR